MRLTPWLLGVVSIVLVAASGCARPPLAQEADFYPPIWTSDGLYLVEQEGPGVLFAAKPPLDLSRYERLFVEEVRLGFSAVRPEFSAREQERAAKMVERNALRMLASQGWERATEPGPATLQMRIAVTGIDCPPIRIHGAGSAWVDSIGGATITVELSDSMTAHRLFLYAQRRQLPWGRYAGPGRIEAERVADAFFWYARDLVRNAGKAGRGELPGPRPFAGTSLEEQPES